MENRESVYRMITSYLQTLGKKALFFKHQDIGTTDIENICKSFPGNDDIKAVFFEYSLNEMKNAYDPFMSCIREAYYSDYSSSYSIEEFVDACGVYTLQREVFSSFIADGICTRRFEVMMNEYEYEGDRIMESVYSAMRYIAENKKLVFVIGKLHMAPLCVLRFLNRIMDRDDNIRFVFTYGESFLVREYCQSEWSILLQRADENKMIAFMQSSDVVQNLDVPDSFDYDETMIGQYIISINNMVHTLALDDAKYYLRIIAGMIGRIDSCVSDKNRFKILELLGMVYLAMEDYKDALLVCEKMVPLFYDADDTYREYVYNYFSAKAHLLMEESNLTHKYCASCFSLAKQLNDDDLLMNAEIVDTIASFGNTKELFRSNFSHRINESILDRARKHGYENFLAYMYVFAYDNDEESVRMIANGQKESVHFNLGIEIANRLDNKNLLLNAYMKNIILYSSFGCYQYVRKMYEKRLQIIDKDKPVRVAHTYTGLGYNAIILEDYEKADGYFFKALRILIENRRAEDIAEILYNMFTNYYVAGINEKAVESIELLLKVMKMIHIQSLKICNTSKMYGILALAYFKMGQYLDSYYCVDKMERIMSYVLNKDLESEENLWEEDLYLYNLCKANLYGYEKRFEKAGEHFKIAYRYLQKNDSIKFYAYVDYACIYGKFLKSLGYEEERNNILSEAYKYCHENGYRGRAAELKSEIDNETKVREITYNICKIPETEIINVCQYVGAEIELAKRKKDIDFMMLCHNFMGKNENMVCNVINQTMNLIRNTFSFDKIALIENKTEKPEFTFLSENVELTDEETIGIVDFFKNYKAEFMTSRLDKEFQRYASVTEKMGGNEVATILGIPIFRAGSLTRIFIATIDVHRNFTENRKLPDDNDLEVIKFAISQLDEEIDRIYNNSMIHIMNEKLENAAVTDQLTGIYNRMGLDKIIKNGFADYGVLLYMDLDNFKQYNDTYGHSVGDSILKLFADIIRRNVEDYGYAIRYGGDEFVAVIPEKDEDFAEDIAKRIQMNLIKESSDKIVNDVVLTSSVGISKYENPGKEGIESALIHADRALYHVKSCEKGKVVRWSEILCYE